MTAAEYDAWADLDDAMNGPDPDYTTEPVPLDDAEQANRALGRVARARRALAKDHDMWEAQRSQLDDWFARRKEIHENAEAWNLRQLEGWHRALLDQDPTRKSVDLPNGVLKSVAGQAKWEFDTATFVPWAMSTEGFEDLVRVTYAPEKAAAKKALDVQGEKAVDPATGEVVPGVTVQPGERSFTANTDPAR